MPVVLVLLGGLKKDDGNGVIQNGLAENDRVQLRVDLVGIENGQYRHRVCCGQRRPHHHGIYKVDVDGIELQSGPEKQYDAENDGRYKCAREGKR